MSLFGKIFGGKKQEVVPTTQEALQKLQEREDMFQKKQDFLEKKIETEVATARTHAAKNKRLALQALKRKKENASMNSDVLSVVADSTKALKKAHNEMDADKVHDLMEEIAEQQEVANEIATAISNPVGLQNDIDDEELMKELNEMEEEALSGKLLDAGIVPAHSIPSVADKLPSAPTELPKKTTAKKQQEDEDLAEIDITNKFTHHTALHGRTRRPLYLGTALSHCYHRS
uniref:Charged multivesicular body protein 4b n=1 Tax=Globodera pallida TaxID=36090 RepID=A0A183BWC8_GLOPA